jgi:hypothetical protein
MLKLIFNTGQRLKMGNFNRKNNGFTVVELLLVIIILILVGFVGWYIYHSDHKTTTSSTKTTTSSSGANKASSYFAITEWGVRAPYSGNLTLEYSVESANSSLPMDVAYLDSSQLDAAAPSCKGPNQYGGAVGGAAGLFERFSASQAYVFGDAGTTNGLTAAQEAATMSASDYGHVGNYYFFYVGPQATCATTSASQTIFNETESTIKSLLPELQAIPSS